jgi:hypothetical protein
VSRFARLCFPLALALATSSPAVRADDGAAAEALFEAGRAATKRGDVREACTRFRESHRLDPAPGTSLNLAVCETELGNLAVAWRLLRSLRQTLSSSDPRTLLVRELFANLDPRVPRVVFESVGELPSGLRVTLEGSSITESGFRVAIPVNPGRHTFEITAPGCETISGQVTLREGERRGVAVSAPPSLERASPRREGAPALEAERARKASLRTWGIFTLGVAGTALAVGAATGIATIDRKNTVDRLCDADGCDDGGVEAAQEGILLSRLSTASFAAGLALAGAGITLVILGRAPPAAASRSLGVHLSLQGILLRGEL